MQPSHPRQQPESGGHQQCIQRPASMEVMVRRVYEETKTVKPTTPDASEPDGIALGLLAA